MKPIAIWDIDGTIFRSSLTIELFKCLVSQRIFPSALMSRVLRSEQHWLNRQGHYDEYIWDVVRAYQKGIIRKKRSQIINASRAVIREQKYRTYRYTRDLLQKLRQKYFLLAISGSPLEVVREYNKFLKFDKVYGTEFGVNERGYYTGKVLHEPPQYKKELIVRYVEKHGFDLKNSIGVGDTESDIGFLELVSRPIAFNPNTKLAAYAKEKNWNIVIERKDLIVEFKPKAVKFLKI
ncbi:MAG: hypothetical protein A2846_00210 [Candidatus Doudnabacteria bacterium RIFCSPHIGHO2_01_FULL_49_9]|uniref:Haloacid dehalogenase n=1 Tax=Candidatus Doudnabacteria bacterium RIFCSPHIGHO2_01_FULL_49_9 TaxID=1817827 RepID=A0A1F5P2W1_9BACT|nr:MAG: hypothetical protein A2846_00210 [Candidatus Doudnabacteria bacterium RIFCSPHIGHO2_01_FULL_49_9]